MAMNRDTAVDDGRREIVDVLPSLYFTRGEVLVTACGHRHLRPVGMLPLHAWMVCPFCTDVLSADYGD
jgi:hypothetical protein